MAATMEQQGEPRADAVASAVRQMGGSLRADGRSRGALAWIASLAAHAAVAALVVSATVTVARMARKPEAPPALVLDFQRPAYAPTVSMIDQAGPVDSAGEFRQAAQLPPAAEASDQAAAQALRGAAEQALLAVRQAQAPAPLAAHEVGRFANAPSSVAINFAGLKASNARRVVYVVDASGSLVGTFPLIVEELRKSLQRLDPRQSFGIIFFQRGEAVTVPPGGALQPATPERVDEALKWIAAKMIPSGRSNPVAAFEAAMAMRPEIVFLLSANITGSGEFEMSEVALMAALDRLNPLDPESGRRLARVQCVQFLDPDPLGTLRRVAREHGGEDGYINITRHDLGLDPQ
jgi:hypothetical protein